MRCHPSKVRWIFSDVDQAVPVRGLLLNQGIIDRHLRHPRLPPRSHLDSRSSGDFHAAVLKSVMTRLKVTGSDQPMPRYLRICVADHVQSTWLERPAATLKRSRRLHARAPRIPASAGGPGTGVGGAVATVNLSMLFHLDGLIPPEVEVTRRYPGGA